jgi:hypothetical protein
MATESFFSQASLAYIASGGAGKDGKAYSIKPTNGDGDFTFSRGSNLAATRVGPTGLIEKGRENLFTYSNDFSDTDWTKNNTSVTGGQSGYDGSSDAWLLDISGGTSGQRIEQSMSFGGIQTFSVYAKAGTLNWIRLRASSNTYFDLANGVIGTDGHIDSKIELVSGTSDWYRCSVVTETSSLARIYLATDDGNVTQSTGSIYIQDAQLEIGLAATDYIESGATTGKAGILEDQPRFDYSGGATCPSLLLEPSRSQLIPYTEYFEGTGWGEVGSFTLTTNTDEVTSPEGLNNATLLTSANATSEQYLSIGSLSTTSGQDYTLSIIAKKKDFDFIILRFQGNGGAFAAGSVWFNLSTGVVATEQSGKTGHIQEIGNGWYKCSATATATGTTASAACRVQLASADNVEAVTGDGSKGTYIYGAGFEQGSYPTSYIPNHSGGSVTRGAEKQVLTGLTSSVLNQTEGSIYLELQTYSTDAGRFTITSYPDGASSDTVRFIFGSNIQFSKVDTGGLSESVNPSASKIKVVGTYSGTQLKLCVNGGSVQTSSGNFSFTNQPTKVYTHAFIDTIRLFADVDQILYFPEALSDADCITLTTL